MKWTDLAVAVGLLLAAIGLCLQSWQLQDLQAQVTTLELALDEQGTVSRTGLCLGLQNAELIAPLQWTEEELEAYEESCGVELTLNRRRGLDV